MQPRYTYIGPTGQGRRFHQLVLALCIAWLMITPSHAQSAQELFAAGVEASRAGDSRAALRLFLDARKRGMNSASLYFNLGVTHYQLGQLKSAESAFRRVTRSSGMAGLAYYNLGLVANKRGEEHRAIAFFRRAEQVAQTDKLRRLSRQARLALEQDGGDDGPVGGAWVQVGAGYDDNALLIPNESTGVSGQSDSLSRVTAYGYARLAGGPDNGLKVEGYFHGERYSELDEFDMDILQAGPVYEWTVGRWRHRVQAAFRRIDLDGGTFQDSRIVDISAKRRLGNALAFNLDIEYETVDAEPAFAYLDGDRRAAELNLRYRRRHEWRLAYRRERHDRDDLFYTDGDFRSFSPVSDTLLLGYETPTRGGFSAGFEVGYKQSRYPDPEVRDGAVAFNREDERGLLSLTTEYRLPMNWRASLELTMYQNDSNFSEFSYERNIVMLGVDRGFEFGD